MLPPFCLLESLPLISFNLLNYPGINWLLCKPVIGSRFLKKALKESTVPVLPLNHFFTSDPSAARPYNLLYSGSRLAIRLCLKGDIGAA